MKNSRVTFATVLGVAFLGLSGSATVQAQTAANCSSGVSTLPPVPQGFAQVADASNRFGYKLLREALRVNPRENVFLSPISASQALEMLLVGAFAPPEWTAVGLTLALTTAVTVQAVLSALVLRRHLGQLDVGQAGILYPGQL